MLRALPPSAFGSNTVTWKPALSQLVGDREAADPAAEHRHLGRHLAGDAAARAPGAGARRGTRGPGAGEEAAPGQPRGDVVSMSALQILTMVDRQKIAI